MQKNAQYILKPKIHLFQSVALLVEFCAKVMVILIKSLTLNFTGKWVHAQSVCSGYADFNDANELIIHFWFIFSLSRASANVVGCDIIGHESIFFFSLYLQTKLFSVRFVVNKIINFFSRCLIFIAYFVWMNMFLIQRNVNHLCVIWNAGDTMLTNWIKSTTPHKDRKRNKNTR